MYSTLEPPPSLLKARLTPSPTDIPGTISFLKSWLQPAALERYSVQWAEWMFLLAVAQDPPPGFLAVRLINGGQPTPLEDAINVLEPRGTYGLPLPVALQ